MYINLLISPKPAEVSIAGVSATNHISGKGRSEQSNLGIGVLFVSVLADWRPLGLR